MATADAPTPIPGRASDADRRKIARLLQEHSTRGRLSRDTFAMRVERALTARSRAELDDPVADVREHGPLRRVEESWLLRDLGSRYGTRVNGMRVTEEIAVRQGDQLSLGGVRYRLGGR
jgi:pSer/pThr/pTyr-binding forkhead associated (FHA) protein